MSAITLLNALRRDAQQLRHSDTANARLHAWATTHPALEEFDDIAALERTVHDRATNQCDVDAVYAALLTGSGRPRLDPEAAAASA